MGLCWVVFFFYSPPTFKSAAPLPGSRQHGEHLAGTVVLKAPKCEAEELNRADVAFSGVCCSIHDNQKVSKPCPAARRQGKWILLKWVLEHYPAQDSFLLGCEEEAAGRSPAFDASQRKGGKGLTQDCTPSYLFLVFHSNLIYFFCR